MRKRLEYVNEIPNPIPEGKILVHNHVSPTPYIGNRGFRVWLGTPNDDVVECACWFAPQLAKHYRVASHPYVEDRATILLGRIYTALGLAEGISAEEGEGREGLTCAEIEEAVIEALNAQ
jgi:hypothetical protein